MDEARTVALEPWLDELVRLSSAGPRTNRFHRMQALWNAIADALAPFIVSAPVQPSHTETQLIRVTPLRDDIGGAFALLEAHPEHPWTLNELAQE